MNWILGVLGTVLSWVLGALPHLSVPSWITSAASFVSGLTAGLSGVSGWVPWNVLFSGVALALAALAISVGIRGFRIVASFLTLGGGS